MRLCARRRFTVVLLSAFVVLLIGADTSWAENDAPVLHFGYATGEDPVAILGKYTPLIHLLENRLQRKVVFVQKRSYREMQQAFLNKTVDFGILNAFSYVVVSKTDKVMPIAARVVAGKKTYQSYIIVRKGGDIHSLRGLIGKTFAYSDPYSTSSYLAARFLLRNNGVDPDTDFRRTMFIRKQDSIFYAVLNRSVDAGACASFIFNEFNRKITSRLLVLARSKPFPLGPFVVRVGLKQKLVTKLKRILLSLDKTPQGRLALKSAEIDRFKPVYDRDYDVVRKMALLETESRQ
jgi:phosphonate transport system substrate-binding protein